MRKISYFLILCTVLAISSCSKSEIPSEEESKEQVNVSFLAQPDVVVTAGTRAAATDLVDAKKFSFYAFKKDIETGTEKYSFIKEISDPAANYNGSEWSSSTSQLAVGTYRFLALYNVKKETLSNMKPLVNKTWSDILNEIVIEHESASADVDEFFSGEALSGDVQVTGTGGNKTVVAFGKLKRVVSRIDIKFIKVATDGKTEVMYSGTNTIFGSKGNLKSIQQTVAGLAKKYSFGGTPLTDNWTTNCVFSFTSLTNLVTIGESEQNSTFPKTTGSDLDTDIDNIPVGRITMGGAYFRGAYVFPFMNATTSDKKKLTQVVIDLKGEGATTAAADDEDRQIKATDNLIVEKNYVTLITVKLMSSTKPGPNPGDNAIPGDDEEHLFNPKVKFTVSVDSSYGGVNNSDVEVD